MCDDIIKVWKTQQSVSAPQPYESASFERLLKSRVKKHTHTAMGYFWSAFTLQLIVFALLSHLMIKYWLEEQLFSVSMAVFLLHLPFTFMLMKKFKAMAIVKPVDNSSFSLYQYTKTRYNLLNDFYRFKRNYERFLVPLSAIAGSYLVFQLYLPGELLAYWNTIWVMIALTILSCGIVINHENKKNFEEPLRGYKIILDEFEEGNLVI